MMTYSSSFTLLEHFGIFSQYFRAVLPISDNIILPSFMIPKDFARSCVFIVTKYKPVVPLYERYKVLMSIKYIDEVVCYDDEDDLLRLIEFYKPDVRILGDDYIGKRFTGDHLPIEVIYTTRSHGWSTTKIKDLITIQTLKQNPEITNSIEND